MERKYSRNLATGLAALIAVGGIGIAPEAGAATEGKREQKIESFFKKYNGRDVDYEGKYGTQCVDIVQFYNKEVVHAPFLSGDGAADIWKTYPKKYYDKIKNTPDAVPHLGDIVIWNRNVGRGKDGKYYGHIAIVEKGNKHSFTSFDQNYPTAKSPSHFQEHNYSNVYGWLRPKKIA